MPWKNLWVIGYHRFMGFSRKPNWESPKPMGYHGLWVFGAMGYDSFDCRWFLEERVLMTPRKLSLPTTESEYISITLGCTSGTVRIFRGQTHVSQWERNSSASDGDYNGNGSCIHSYSELWRSFLAWGRQVGMINDSMASNPPLGGKGINGLLYESCPVSLDNSLASPPDGLNWASSNASRTATTFLFVIIAHVGDWLKPWWSKSH